MPAFQHYAVGPSEPALYVEIYLPRKAQLQGTLYDTLTAGFKLRAVREHFLTACADRRERIRLMLERGWPLCRGPYSDDEIRSLPRLFFGYTTYDVDGVYLREIEPTSGGDGDANFAIMEEGTQIIRIVFRVPEELRQHGHLIRDSAIGDVDDATTAELRQWVRYVGLFLFGFVMERVCGDIVTIQASPDSPTTDPPVKQDEIWVCSFWNLVLNPLEHVPGS